MIDTVQPITNALFTPANIAGVGVATGAVTVFTSALYKLAKLPQRWTAFIAALAIAYVVIFLSTAPHWYDWVLAFFNACLLYCSSLGVNEMVSSPTSTPGKGFAATEPFFTSWLRT